MLLTFVREKGENSGLPRARLLACRIYGAAVRADALMNTYDVGAAQVSWVHDWTLSLLNRVQAQGALASASTDLLHFVRQSLPYALTMCQVALRDLFSQQFELRWY